MKEPRPPPSPAPHHETAIGIKTFRDKSAGSSFREGGDPPIGAYDRRDRRVCFRSKAEHDQSARTDRSGNALVRNGPGSI